jgi:hypothetical protein
MFLHMVIKKPPINRGEKASVRVRFYRFAIGIRVRGFIKTYGWDLGLGLEWT